MTSSIVSVLPLWNSMPSLMRMRIRVGVSGRSSLASSFRILYFSSKYASPSQPGHQAGDVGLGDDVLAVDEVLCAGAGDRQPERAAPLTSSPRTPPPSAARSRAAGNDDAERRGSAEKIFTGHAALYLTAERFVGRRHGRPPRAVVHDLSEAFGAIQSSAGRKARWFSLLGVGMASTSSSTTTVGPRAREPTRDRRRPRSSSLRRAGTRRSRRSATKSGCSRSTPGVGEAGVVLVVPEDPVAAVVDHEEREVQVVLLRGRELGDAVLEASVADDRQDGSPAARPRRRARPETRSRGCSSPRGRGTAAARRRAGTSTRCRRGSWSPRPRPRRRGGRARSCRAARPRDWLLGERRARRLLGRRLARAAPPRARAARSVRGARRSDLLRVADETERRPVPTADALGRGVDLDQRPGAASRPAGLVAEPGPTTSSDIGVGDEVAERRVVPGASERERMVLRERALARVRGGDGGVETLRELDQLPVARERTAPPPATISGRSATASRAARSRSVEAACGTGSGRGRGRRPHPGTSRAQARAARRRARRRTPARAAGRGPPPRLREHPRDLVRRGPRPVHFTSGARLAA